MVTQPSRPLTVLAVLVWRHTPPRPPPPFRHTDNCRIYLQLQWFTWGFTCWSSHGSRRTLRQYRTQARLNYPQCLIVQLRPLGVKFGHFLRCRLLKGRCNIRVYVPVCVCVFLCVSLLSPPDPTHTVGLNSRIPPTPLHNPSPPFPHPYPQATARPTPGKNYPLKSA